GRSCGLDCVPALNRRHGNPERLIWVALISCCGGCLWSASASQLALGMYSLDAGVGVGLLMLVDPSGWDPFGEPVGVDAAALAFFQEVGVVVLQSRVRLSRSVGPPR